MTSDLNKGITDIQYNSLNLPQLIEINSPNAEAKIKYTYSASGQKLRVDRAANLAREQSPITGKDAINAIIGQPVRDGFLGSLHITDYVGNKVYEQGNLRRILVDGGYIENNIYHFYLTDHLGNNRIVSKADGTALQRNMYYAFGAVTAQEVGGSVQPYKYNAKELDRKQNLDLYDYSARHYDGAIGRFTTVDPLAENYYSWNPYVYCANNPIRFIDPDGRMFGPPDNPGLGTKIKALAKAWFVGDANYKGSAAYMHSARVLSRSLYGIDNNASSVCGAVMASLAQYDEVNLTGKVIDQIKADPEMQAKERSFISDIKGNDKFGKENFTVEGIKLNVQFGGSRGDGQGSWEFGKTFAVAKNPLTLLIRNCDINARATVSKDGKGVITYSLSPNEKLDLRPNGSEPSYDKVTSILGFIYHDLFGGNDQMKTKATWTTEIK